MSICEYCNRDMKQAESCIIVHLHIDGREWLPAPFIGEGDEYRCGDCNVLAGGYHHPGCDQEVCPKCNGQLISCDCLD